MTEHEYDATTGETIHVDIDPFIPTGICAICTGTPQEELPPEDRAEIQEESTP